MPRNQGQAAQRELNPNDSISDVYAGDDIRERKARKPPLHRFRQASLLRPPNKPRDVRQYRERRPRASGSSTRTADLQDRGRSSRKNPGSHQNGELGMTTKTGFHRSMIFSSERAQGRTVSLPGPCGKNRVVNIFSSQGFCRKLSMRCEGIISNRRASDSYWEYSSRLPNGSMEDEQFRTMGKGKARHFASTAACV